MKNLYNDNEDYTAAASEVDRKVYDALKPIFDDFIKRGFSRREVSYTMQNAVHDLELNSLVFRDDPPEKRYAAKGPSWIEKEPGEV